LDTILFAVGGVCKCNSILHESIGDKPKGRCEMKDSIRVVVFDNAEGWVVSIREWKLTPRGNIPKAANKFILGWNSEEQRVRLEIVFVNYQPAWK
jgi:hypothetical protein